MNQLKKDIGNRLREIRERNHLSQEKTAELIGISSKHYSAVERGESGFKIPTWIKASEVLHFDIHEVLCGQPSKYSINENTDFYSLNALHSEKDYLLRHILRLVEEYGEECRKEPKH